jgi:hypothetical protein
MKYITCADTAAMLRKALKESFKGIKFSVKSRTYSMGASIDVRWEDGPNAAQVEAITNRFQGSYFDGMQDLKGARYHMIDGMQVHLGADYIHTNRSYSEASISRAIDRVFRQFAGNFSGSDVSKPTVADYRDGRTMLVQIPRMNAHHMHTLSYFISQALHKNSDRLAVANSPTAAAIFQTHTDGNGQSSFDTHKATL